MKKVIVFGISNFVRGGAQRQLVRLLPHLIDEYEVHLVVLYDYPPEEVIISELPKEVVIHQLHFKSFYTFTEWKKLSTLLKEVKPALIVSSFYFSNVVFRMLGRMLHVPVIAREHNTTTNKSFFQRTVDRWLAKSDYPIIAVSSEVAKTVSEEVGIPEDTFVVINNGINLQEVDEAAKSVNESETRAGLHVPLDAKVAVVIGRLVNQKRVDQIVKGFAEFAQTHSEWYLVVVGGGWQLPALQDLATELGIASRVRFTGEQENVHKYYRIADCLLSASKMEGLSNVHLEALAHGVPILTTPTGGTSAVVVPRETGLIISEGESAEITKALREFTKAPAETFKEASLKHRTQFSIEETASQYKNLFNKLINNTDSK